MCRFSQSVALKHRPAASAGAEEECLQGQTHLQGTNGLRIQDHCESHDIHSSWMESLVAHTSLPLQGKCVWQNLGSLTARHLYFPVIAECGFPGCIPFVLSWNRQPQIFNLIRSRITCWHLGMCVWDSLDQVHWDGKTHLLWAAPSLRQRS